MNQGSPSNGANGQPSGSGVNLDDIYFTVFRHKWLIIGFTCLGIFGAAALRFLRPAPYVSKAKLMLLYVNNVKPGLVSSNQDEQVVPIDPQGQAILNSEIAILESMDVASNVAALVRPERVLAQMGGGSNIMAAAGVIADGVEVEVPPRTAILTVSFRHRDPSIVQPVLEALLKTYQRSYIELHEKTTELDQMYTKDSHDLSAEISDLDQQIKDVKSHVKVIIPDDAMHFYQNRYSKAKDDLFDAERDLAEHKAMFPNPDETPASTGTTNTNEAPVPQDVMNDYSEIASDLDDNKKRERALIREGYLDAFPLVQRVRENIENLKKKKSDLELQYPTLKHFALAGVPGATNSPVNEMVANAEETRRLTAKVAVCATIVSNIEVEASGVLDIQPRLAQLERKRDEDQRKFDSVVSRLSRVHGNGVDQLINMSMVQTPSPPKVDYKKFYKKIGAVLGGCIGMGFALAFLIDLVLDRSIKRSKEIERSLHLPVFLAIPDTAWTGGLRMPWSKREYALMPSPARDAGANGAEPEKSAMVKLDSQHPIQAYVEGLRERLITYFEVHNLNLKKPKLVGVTGCGSGSGVTTLASGLAAELSKTGDGNVLLVDMNVGQGVAHPFCNGKPGCGLAEALEPDGRAGAQVEDNLYMASAQPGTNDKLTKSLPNRFNNLVPKLKASDYDYIIFDLPPVSPTSSTPRLASHMDIVLMVVEAEKTGHAAAARAAALMREGRTNLAAVLNKCRPHVPAALSPEL